jgi:hypothetical protein
MTLASVPPPVQEIPMPLIFDIIPRNWQRGAVQEALIQAAATIGLKCVVSREALSSGVNGEMNAVIPLLAAGSDVAAFKGLSKTPLIMLEDGPHLMRALAALEAETPAQIAMVRLPATAGAVTRIRKLAEMGIESVHLAFDGHGREQRPEGGRHMREVIREVHTALVKDGTRDELSFSVSGGIALAEHMAKAVLCGADFVAVDLPLLIAMECRLCRDCEQELSCQVTLEEAEEAFLTRRVVNLVGAWHSQLLEMMGAMGIREARRLRGETGRCMFFEDLEAETFGCLFGERKREKGGTP